MIKDEQIKEFCTIVNNSRFSEELHRVKEYLKSICVEVEEKKSKLDEARELVDQYHNDYTDHIEEVIKIAKTYEEANKEKEQIIIDRETEVLHLQMTAKEQQKQKIDADLKEKISHWIFSNKDAGSWAQCDIDEITELLKQLGIES